MKINNTKKMYIGHLGSGTREQCIQEAVKLQEKFNSKVIILSDDSKIKKRFKKNPFDEFNIVLYDLKKDDERIFFIHRGENIIYFFDNLERIETLNSYVYDYLFYSIYNNYNVFIYSQEGKIKNKDCKRYIDLISEDEKTENDVTVKDFSFKPNPSFQKLSEDFEYNNDNIKEKIIKNYLIKPLFEKEYKNLYKFISEYTSIGLFNQPIGEYICIEDEEDIKLDKIFFTLNLKKGGNIVFEFLTEKNIIKVNLERTIIYTKDTIVTLKENLAELQQEAPDMMKLNRIEAELEIEELEREIEQLKNFNENFTKQIQENNY